MKILLLNPNTSADMTQRLLAQARAQAPPGTQWHGATARFGCEVIASRASFAVAAHAALDAYAEAGGQGPWDAVLLACFGDPGLAALREAARVPVLGLLEAALVEAGRHSSFAIVTPGRPWIAMLEEQLRCAGVAHACRGVFALEATGLQVSRQPDSVRDAVQEAIDAAAGAACVILGGSALAGFEQRVSSAIPLIDPVRAAIAGLLPGAAPGQSPARGARPAWRGLPPALTELLQGD